MLDFVRLIRWQDILDIAVVSIILYQVFLIIKGTRAARMLVGVGFLLIISFFAKYFQLSTLDWILQSFWSQVVIVLIIVFQQEIRRTLAHMGATSFFQNFTSAEELKSLEEIVRAAVACANRKIGALLVIERDVSLNDYVEVGTPLDAKVNKDLLLSIFHPTSPIHDGAVIIRGNRVVAAGCFLPIKLGTEMSKSLGTRHRAGFGLTEETDAVAIIVSEETGQISLAMNGEMQSHIDMGALRDILTDLFTTKKKPEALKAKPSGNRNG
ncbi:MAG TPA: diadenylate cyclase CdaA [Dissulfurispiraceae bacterium]|nr:diadenylate cyclase CdaA [Dissulfurispiraceae bacterium]